MPAPEQVLAPVRLPFSTLLLDGLLAAAIMAIPRIAVRFAARNPITTRRAQHRALIIGAVADLRHARRLTQVFDRFRPDAIFHAAAHKHVPLMEENVVEAITNNILGTGNLVEAATELPSTGAT